jgi:hypothetical protein
VLHTVEWFNDAMGKRKYEIAKFKSKLSAKTQDKCRKKWLNI